MRDDESLNTLWLPLEKREIDRDREREKYFI